MKVVRKREDSQGSFSLSCVVCASLLAAGGYYEVRITFLGALGVLGLGLCWFIGTWVRLGCRLGICPGVFHSSSCVPLYKKDEFYFRSSGVLELGFVNGILDTVLVYAYTQSSSNLFYSVFCVFSVVSGMIDQQKYLISDFLGSFFMFSGMFYYITYGIPDDYVYQILLCFGFGKQMVISRFKSQLEELRSVTIISSVTQGLALSIFSYFYLPFGTLEDLFFPLFSVLVTYTLLESSLDKLANFYSILTLPMYTFQFYLNYASIGLSTLGFIFLVFGGKVCSLCSTRLNLSFKYSSSLKDSLL